MPTQAAQPQSHRPNYSYGLYSYGRPTPAPSALTPRQPEGNLKKKTLAYELVMLRGILVLWLGRTVRRTDLVVFFKNIFHQRLKFLALCTSIFLAAEMA